nr:histidine kinase [Chromobacterium sp. ASV5]
MSEPPRLSASPMPDFRNLGVMLRVLSLLTLLLLIDALLAEDGQQLWRLLQRAGQLVPGALLTLACLALFTPHLQRLRRPQPWIVLLTALAFGACQRWLTLGQDFNWGVPLVAALMAGLLLHYFRLRDQALAPALAEARLAALQSRIRPHFLFNSLNAAIALIRLKPPQAEMVLENLAELFRAQLADPGRDSTLGREIELTRMYLAIEQERLGERLRVAWDIDAPLDAGLPPLILQPLAENAVLHGVESCPDGGEIRIAARLRQGMLLLTLRNPRNAAGAPRQDGHRMALANLTERLSLFFDAEASVETEADDDGYRTVLRLPYRLARPGHPESFAE